MSFSRLSTRTSSNINASADINQLSTNDDGLAIAAYTSGSSTVTLTSASNRRQLLAPTADHLVTLPTTGILRGECFEFINFVGTFRVRIESSDGDDKCDLYNGSVRLIALQDTPTDKTHWDYIDYPIRQYVVGTAAINGTPGITCPNTNFAITRGVLVPYRTNDNGWRLKGNIVFTQDATGTDPVLTFNGVTFKNVTNYNQASMQVTGTSTTDGSENRNAALTTYNASTMTLTVTTASTTNGSVSFDVELDSKPTWAD